MLKIDTETFRKMKACIGYREEKVRFGLFVPNKNKYVTPDFGDSAWEALVCEGYADGQLINGAMHYMLTADGIEYMEDMLNIIIECDIATFGNKRRPDAPPHARNGAKQSD